MGKLWRLAESLRGIWWAMYDGFETGVLWQIGVFWWLFPLFFIVESMAILLMEALGGVIVCWWSVRYSVVGLRVSLVVYKEFCSSLELFPPTATPPSSSTILNNITSLLPFVLKMSQQQVGSLVLTIVVDDLMSILFRTMFVSINPLMAWWEKSPFCLRLVSR